MGASTHELIPTSNAEIDIAALFRSAKLDVVAAMDSRNRTPHLYMVFPRSLPVRRVAAAAHIATATAQMMSPESVRWGVSLAFDVTDPHEVRLFVRPTTDLEAGLVGTFLRFLAEALTESIEVAEG